MGEIQEKEDIERQGESQEDPEQASLFVGKIPAGQGLWAALGSIRTCDKVRNGVLVVFSPQSSGRIGVFCNQAITGAVVDSSGERGAEGIRQLLNVKSGMFCFRPCFGDETAELGQKISLDIRELLEAAEQGKHDDVVSTLNHISLSEINAALDGDYLGAIEEGPVESSLVIMTGGSSESVAAAAESKPKAPPTDKASEEDGTDDYFDWLDQGKSKNEGPTLRKILMPALPAQNEGPDQSEQVNRDLAMYKKVLQQEEERVKRDIEKTLEKASENASAQQALADMQMLAGMLHQQEEMISRRWEGLDAIPTPKVTKDVHMDSSGQFRTGAPVRSTKEFLRGCEDLINSSIIPTDPQKFLRKNAEDAIGLGAQSLLQHPRVIAGGVLGAVLLICYLVSQSVTGSHVNNYMAEGKEHVRAERWSEAILAFDDVLLKDPGNGQAYFYRGIAMEESGDDKQAQKDFEAARKYGVPSENITIAQAGIEIRKEQWDKALEVCDKAIKSGTKNPTIYRMDATANLHLRNFAEAKVDCDTALSLVKDDAKQKAEILADRGYAKIQMRDFEGGAQDFGAALAGNPKESLYMLKGDAYRAVKRYHEAIATYSKALELNPLSYDAYVARGICEAGANEKQLALKDFGRALQMNPSGVEALIQRGSLQLSLGAYRLALDDLQQAWELNPTISETRQKLMQAYALAKKNVPKGLMLAAASSQPAKKLPSDPQQLVAMGYSALSQGDMEQAIDCLALAVKKAPSNATARRYLAHAFALCGEYDSAVSQFQTLGSLAGGYQPEDAAKYADALEKTGNSRAAVDVLTRAMVGNPSNSDLRYRLAQIYYRAGQTQVAAQTAEEGMQRASSPAEREKFYDLIHNSDKPGSRPTGPDKMTTGTHG